MANQYKRILRKRSTIRVYPGESESKLLVQWLNVMRDSKAKENAVSLIEAGKKLSELDRQGNFPRVRITPSRPGVFGTKAQFANAKRRSELSRTVNKLLSKQKMFPSYLYSIRSSWKVSWIHTTNKRRLALHFFAGGNAEAIRFGEADAIASILRLAERGYLDSLCRCHSCDKWIYARFNHQRFCGEPCKQRDFRNTDEWRARQREYMREHRKTVAKLLGRPFRARSSRRIATLQSQ
jgi:hypothetical protein